MSGINVEAHHLNNAVCGSHAKPRRYDDRINPTRRTHHWMRRQSVHDLVRERLRADTAGTRGGLGVHVDRDDEIRS